VGLVSARFGGSCYHPAGTFEPSPWLEDMCEPMCAKFESHGRKGMFPGADVSFAPHRAASSLDEPSAAGPSGAVDL
jgi:hypothetical protein